jgi:hypothetical protein
MRRRAFFLFVFLAAAPLCGASGKEYEARVAPPARLEAPCRLEGSTVVYETAALAAAARLLPPSDEAAFMKLRTGKEWRLFSHDDGSSPFWVFVLTLKNRSKETLYFNPGYASLQCKRRGGWNSLEITDLMRFFRERAPGQAAELQPVLEEILWSGAVSISPGGSMSKILVFRPFPAKPKDRAMTLECSWLTLGQESMHLVFPFALEPARRR